MPFQIDDVAFDRLQNYLAAVRAKFQGMPGVGEIMDDIESRIAEMFQSQLKSSGRTIVSTDDVDAAIKVMGMPDDFDTFDDEEGRSSSSYGAPYRTGRKLFRDPDDRVLGGVISGLSQYLGFSSPTPLRILWAALPIADLVFIPGTFTGFMILLYIVLWIAIPLAKTPTEKMEMRGEPINIDNIQKTAGSAYDSVRQNVNSSDFREGSKRVGSFLERFVMIVSRVLLFLGLMLSVLALVGIIIGFFFVVFGFSAAVPYLSDFVFGNGIWSWIGLIGLLLTSLALPVFLTALFSKLLFQSPFNMPNIAMGSLAAFIVGIILSSITTAHIIRDFAIRGESKEVKTLMSAPQEVTIMGNGYDDDAFEDDFFNEIRLSHHVHVDIIPTDDSLLTLSLYKFARGRNESVADGRAENIDYHYEFHNAVLGLDDEFELAQNAPWRAQRVEAVLRVPYGTTIDFDASARNIIDEAKVNGNYYGGSQLVDRKRWKLLENGLFPVDKDGEIIPEKETESTDENVDEGQHEEGDWHWDDENFSLLIK